MCTAFWIYSEKSPMNPLGIKSRPPSLISTFISIKKVKYVQDEQDFKYLVSDLTNPNNCGPHHKRVIVFRFFLWSGGGEVLYRYSIEQ